MKGLLFFSALFLVGSFYNVYQMDLADAYIGFIIFGILITIYMILRKQSQKSNEFINWILYNRDKIIREGATYEDIIQIDKDTEITQFYICLSFFVFTAKLPTRYYIKDYENTLFASLLCTLTTLIGGWWGLPWGPIYTLQVVFKNVTGGKKTTVTALLNEVDEHNEKIIQRYSVRNN